MKEAIKMQHSELHRHQFLDDEDLDDSQKSVFYSYLTQLTACEDFIEFM
jgi:hypothetical protein